MPLVLFCASEGRPEWMMKLSRKSDGNVQVKLITNNLGETSLTGSPSGLTHVFDDALLAHARRGVERADDATRCQQNAHHRVFV